MTDAGAPAATTPEELHRLAVVLDTGYETAPADASLVSVTQALGRSRLLLRDCTVGSPAFDLTTLTMGMLEATRGCALYACGHWSDAWEAYTAADGMFGRAGRPDAQLWVRTRQSSLEVHRGRPARGCARAVMARRFAEENGLTGHLNFARFLTQGEARALIATGQTYRAMDTLAQANAVMDNASPTNHLGLSQLSYSRTEHGMLVGMRHNEVAAAESGAVAERARMEAVRHVTSTWRDLDEGSVTGLRSYSRVELARTLVDDEPRVAADLLATAADISQDRPTSHLIVQYRAVAREVADRDIELGRALTSRLREWLPAGATRRGA
jgi:hypothetical protein